MKVLGIGAAGNKSVELLLTKGLINIDDILLINSTNKDLTNKSLETRFVNIGSNKGGCGKERTLGHKYALSSLQNNLGKSIDMLIEDEDDTIALVTSAEGGTGSGATPIIAKYLYEELGLNVHVFVYTGFEEDSRGLANTVELFKELSTDVVVHIIRNSTFLQESKGSYPIAERLANEYFCEMYNIVCGVFIKDSFQNMDDTDLFKSINFPGYSVIKKIKLDRTVTEPEQIEEEIRKGFRLLNTFKNDTDNNSVRVLGSIISVTDPTIAIDRKFTDITDIFGVPYERFNHTQQVDPDEQSIIFIISGMHMPENEITAIYNRYLKTISSINREHDNFYDTKLETDNEDFNFASGRRAKKNKSSFFENNKIDNKVIAHNGIDPKNLL